MVSGGLVRLASTEKVVIVGGRSVVGGSCELVGVVTKESAFASQEV
jgi:hypothetical protein